MIDNQHLINLDNAALQSLNLSEFLLKDLKIDILRLDKIHPVVSGNKWFKLKYYFEDARKKNYNTVLTFGGAWSNHIIATAYISKCFNFHTIGVIRGERPLKLSHTLLDAIDRGMTLEFINRGLYSRKNDDSFKKILEEKFGHVYFIPEGGAGIPGIKGSKEILNLTETECYSHIICCIGTGTMYAGLVDSSLPEQEVIGIPVLKGITFFPEQITETQQKKFNCKIIYDYHFGGYAKKTGELIQCMNNFYLQTGIPTDFVYTGKLIFALSDLVSKNYFPAGSKILAIHSGGLQGNGSLPKGTLLF